MAARDVRITINIDTEEYRAAIDRIHDEVYTPRESLRWSRAILNNDYEHYDNADLAEDIRNFWISHWGSSHWDTHIKVFSTEAKEKSKELLLSYLDEDQLTQFQSTGYFATYGSDSGERYEIHNYTPQNVVTEKYTFCLESVTRIPLYDQLLIQKLLIETNERKFLELAIKTMNSLPF